MEYIDATKMPYIYQEGFQSHVIDSPAPPENPIESIPEEAPKAPQDPAPEPEPQPSPSIIQDFSSTLSATLFTVNPQKTLLPTLNIFTPVAAVPTSTAVLVTTPPPHLDAKTILSQIDLYVITMERSNRLQNIQAQVDKIAQMNKEYPMIGIHRMDAVDGDSLDLVQLYQMGKLKKCVIQEEECPGFTVLSNRKYEVACLLSHVKTLSQIMDKKNPDDYSIILEDDFTIEDNFVEILVNVMRQIKEKKIDFDILFLGVYVGGNDMEEIGPNLFKLKCQIGQCYGAHGYLIPNNRAEELIKTLSYIDNVVDVKMYSASNLPNIYRVHPNIINQGGLGSTIRFG